MSKIINKMTDNTANRNQIKSPVNPNQQSLRERLASQDSTLSQNNKKIKPFQILRPTTRVNRKDTSIVRPCIGNE